MMVEVVTLFLVLCFDAMMLSISHNRIISLTNFISGFSSVDQILGTRIQCIFVVGARYLALYIFFFQCHILNATI